MNDKAMTGHDRVEILTMKDNQIADLRNQLEKAEAQLQSATTEKTKLLDLPSVVCGERGKARTHAPSRRKRERFITGKLVRR